VITRPTTQQLLDDCAREVRETIMPLVQDPAARVRLEMLEQLLTSCAVRSAHEIAWMDEEREVMRAFAAEVAAGRPEASALAEALAADQVAPEPSLHLDDRVAAYDRAGQAFCEAIDVALHGDDPDLAAKATALVRARKDREADTRPGFFFPGRR